jgi:hypothetical protein
MKILIPIVAISLVLLMGCSKDDPAPQTGFLRVLHGVPDAPAVEVRVNGTLLATIGAYGLSMPYSSLNAGSVNVQFRLQGTATDFFSATVNVTSNAYSTLILADSAAKLKTSLVIEDPIPAAGKAKINIYHLGTIASAASFTSNGNIISGNRTFNDQQANATVVTYTNVDAGSFILESRQPGTSGSTGLIGSSTQTLQAGKSYTYVFRNPLPPSSIPSITFISN